VVDDISGLMPTHVYYGDNHRASDEGEEDFALACLEEGASEAKLAMEKARNEVKSQEKVVKTLEGALGAAKRAAEEENTLEVELAKLQMQLEARRKGKGEEEANSALAVLVECIKERMAAFGSQAVRRKSALHAAEDAGVASLKAMQLEVKGLSLSLIQCASPQILNKKLVEKRQEMREKVKALEEKVTRLDKERDKRLMAMERQRTALKWVRVEKSASS